MPTFLESLAATDLAREETALILLRREERALASHRATEQVRQLLEHDWEVLDPHERASDPGLGSAANDLLHYGAIGAHNARPGSRRHGDCPPYYRTEQQHAQTIDSARTLEAMCSTGVNVLEILTQFAIHTGFVYKVMPRGDKGGSADLVEKAQRLIDDWHKFVNWYGWETEIFRRVIRDGEDGLILEPDDIMGFYDLRSFEPEQLKEPTDSLARSRDLGIRSDSSWKYGILTSKENTSIPRGYWIVSQYAQAWRGTFYPAEEIFHLKSQGTDRQSKRGISEFFQVANDIPGAKKLLRNLREGGAVQAAIAFLRQHPKGMDPVAMGTGADPTNVTRSGVRTSSVHLDGPTILDVTYGMEYVAGPIAESGKAGILIEVLQAALRGIGVRWQMPEGMISGDASNANLASALVAEGPFVRAMQFRQWHFRLAYQSLHERMLDAAAIKGMLGPARENILDDLEISVKMPPVLARKPKEETERLAILDERGAISLESWRALEDLNHEEEEEKIARQPDREPEQATDEDGEPADGDQPQTERDLK